MTTTFKICGITVATVYCDALIAPVMDTLDDIMDAHDGFRVTYPNAYNDDVEYDYIINE